MLLWSMLTIMLAYEGGGLGGVLPLGNEAVNQLYKEERYDEALQRYLELYDRDPDNGVLAYNIGNTYAALGDLAKAGEYFEKAAEAGDELARNRARYNLGNLQMNQQQFGEAVKRYIDYLQENPDDIDAKRNLELALRQMQQQPPQQNQQQDEQDEQDQQDQQDQQQSQSQSQSSSEDESQQDQSQQNDSGQSQEESSQSEQNPDQQPQDQPQDQPQSQPEGDAQSQPQPQDEQGTQQNQPQTSDKEMDEQLKEQILEALNDQERQQQKQHQKRKAGANKRRAKDW